MLIGARDPSPDYDLRAPPSATPPPTASVPGAPAPRGGSVMSSLADVSVGASSLPGSRRASLERGALAPAGATPGAAASTAAPTSAAAVLAPSDSGAPRLRLRREEWALDRNYPHCHLCKDAFTLLNRRHHCRSCGLVFCEPSTCHTRPRVTPVHVSHPSTCHTPPSTCHR